MSGTLNQEALAYFKSSTSQKRKLGQVHFHPIHLECSDTGSKSLVLIRCPVFSLFNSSSSKADFSWKGFNVGNTLSKCFSQY